MQKLERVRVPRGTGPCWRGFAGLLKDAMVRRGVVSNILAGVPGHVAVDASVVLARLPSQRFRFAAIGRLVATQAAVAIVSVAFLGTDVLVGVVAGRAAQLALAFL